MKKILYSIMFSAAIVMSSCTADDMITGDNQNNNDYTVKIKLGGSAKSFGNLPLTKAGETANEGKVSTLIAVAFVDIDAQQGIANYEVPSESDDDTFYKIIDVNIPTQGQVPMSDLDFGLGKEGVFQICFIANASEDLKSELNEILQTSANTVKSLKDYVMDIDASSTAQAPEAGDGTTLMVSPFYQVSTSFTEDVNTVPVVMTRRMARIDIENACNGINIHNIIFKNRAIGTRLFSQTTQAANTWETSKTYDLTKLIPNENGLVGNEESPVKYEAGIYSYEQLNTNATCPVLEIQYQMPSHGTQLYKHEIQFNGDTKIIKPNYLFNVKITNSKDDLNFTLTVADWDNAETPIDITVDQIVGGLQGKGEVVELTTVGDVPAWTGDGEPVNVTAQ